MIFIKRDSFFNKICLYYDGLDKVQGFEPLEDKDKDEFEAFKFNIETQVGYIKEKNEILNFLHNTDYLVIEQKADDKLLEKRKKLMKRLREIKSFLHA